MWKRQNEVRLSLQYYPKNLCNETKTMFLTCTQFFTVSLTFCDQCIYFFLHNFNRKVNKWTDIVKMDLSRTVLLLKPIRRRAKTKQKSIRIIKPNSNNHSDIPKKMRAHQIVTFPPTTCQSGFTLKTQRVHKRRNNKSPVAQIGWREV